MKKATAAFLFHVASSATYDFHIHCPSVSDSLCLFKADKANDTGTYKSSPGLPIDIIKVVKPIYQDLYCESLLQKCTHGQTQNQKETLDGMVLYRVPKHADVGQKMFETSAYDAVQHFSIGNLATLRIFKPLGIEPITYTRLGYSALNKNRVENVRCHNKTNFKLRWRIIRSNRKRKADEIERVKRKLYCFGITNPAGKYLLKGAVGVVLVSLWLTLNIFHTLF